MRKVAHGILFFKDPQVKKRLDELMLHQCSATRSAYQALHKHNLKNNDVKKYVKKDYSQYLNASHIADACTLASQINQEHAIFGGKINWKRLQTGTISKEEWLLLRNNQLYSRGDRDREGNRNLRVNLNENKLLINDPSARGKWLECNIYISEKFFPQLDCYDVRIVRKNERYEVKIGWEENTQVSIETVPGAIGIDTNPDGVALVETDGDGNLVHHRYLQYQRLSFAKQDKRNNDVRLLAKEVVDYALEKKKTIVLERLEFKVGKKTKTYKKSNRMKSNFLFKKIVVAIESRALRFGVSVKKVNPGYTSILGNLKYRSMYSLNRHTAAALVIARRGMNIDKERQTFSAVKVRKSSKKDNVNLEGRSHSETLKSVQSWQWMTKYLRHPKLTEHTALTLVPLPIEYFIGSGINASAGGIPASEHLITGQML